MHGRGAKTLRLCKFTTNHNTQSARFFNFFLAKMEDFGQFWSLKTRYTVHGRGAKTLRLRVELNFKSEHFLEKSSKKSFKNGPKYFSFAKDIYTLTTFLQKVLKPVFQNPTVERHVSTPHIRLAKVTKNPDERTDERTNERTDGTSGFD